MQYLPDQHTIYKSNKKLTIEEELEGIESGQSQFQRAMVELGVEVIHANSPQAKGRIEQLFRTLQDRLVKEMKLKGICNCEDANLFLEPYLIEHNKDFASPASKRANLHRSMGKGIKLDTILSVKELRRLRKLLYGLLVVALGRWLPGNRRWLGTGRRLERCIQATGPHPFIDNRI